MLGTGHYGTKRPSPQDASKWGCQGSLEERPHLVLGKAENLNFVLHRLLPRQWPERGLAYLGSRKGGIGCRPSRRVSCPHFLAPQLSTVGARTCFSVSWGGSEAISGSVRGPVSDQVRGSYLPWVLLTPTGCRLTAP